MLARPWDPPGKNTGVGCHFLLQCMKVKSERKSLSCVRLLATPWTTAYQALPSIGFSRQEYWSGVPLPSPLLTADVSKCKAVLILMLLGVKGTPTCWREINMCCATEECRGGFVLTVLAGFLWLPGWDPIGPAAVTVQDSDRPVAVGYREQVYKPATTVTTVSNDSSVTLLTLLLQQEGN